MTLTVQESIDALIPTILQPWWETFNDRWRSA